MPTEISDLTSPGAYFFLADEDLYQGATTTPLSRTGFWVNLFNVSWPSRWYSANSDFAVVDPPLCMFETISFACLPYKLAFLRLPWHGLPIAKRGLNNLQIKRCKFLDAIKRGLEASKQVLNLKCLRGKELLRDHCAHDVSYGRAPRSTAVGSGVVSAYCTATNRVFGHRRRSQWVCRERSYSDARVGHPTGRSVPAFA